MGQSSSPEEGRPTFSGRIVDGRYRIEQTLGSGAVGAVFAAIDMETGQRAALKLWHGTADQGQARGRFVREAKALDTLRHPNIVEVFGAGLIDDQPYVAMEFLEGQTLEDALLPGQGLDAGLAFHIIHQVLGALAYAHERKVLHRDLKPENIFLTTAPDGTPHVKLLDYGLAKFLGVGDDPLGGAAITMTGMVLGTPLYMPPEQAAGGKIDLRADVYAAGCILFEMLSGRLPYLGDDYGQLIRAHITAPIPKLQDAQPQCWVAPALQTVFDTAMAKNPAQRYADAGQMLTAVEMLPQPAIRPSKAGGGNEAAQTMRERHGAQPQAGHRMLLIGAATGVVLAVALTLALLR